MMASAMRKGNVASLTNKRTPLLPVGTLKKFLVHSPDAAVITHDQCHFSWTQAVRCLATSVIPPENHFQKVQFLINSKCID